MNYGGEAAEQVVRMSLAGMEVAVKITGSGAKNLAVLLAAALKEEQKTQGKARLTSMLKSGKELTIFTMPAKDIKIFAAEAKRYGVLYSVIKDRQAKTSQIVDIITRAEDAPKINRIIERFHLIIPEKGDALKSDTADDLRREIDPEQLLEEVLSENPQRTGRETEYPSGKSSKQEMRDSTHTTTNKLSVREQLAHYRKSEKSEDEGLQLFSGGIEQKRRER